MNFDLVVGAILAFALLVHICWKVDKRMNEKGEKNDKQSDYRPDDLSH